MDVEFTQCEPQCRSHDRRLFPSEEDNEVASLTQPNASSKQIVDHELLEIETKDVANLIFKEVLREL